MIFVHDLNAFVFNVVTDCPNLISVNPVHPSNALSPTVTIPPQLIVVNLTAPLNDFFPIVCILSPNVTVVICPITEFHGCVLSSS